MKNYDEQNSLGDGNISLCILGGGKNFSDEMCSLRCQEQDIENPTPTSCAKCGCAPTNAPIIHFSGISRDLWGLEEKLWASKMFLVKFPIG